MSEPKDMHCLTCGRYLRTITDAWWNHPQDCEACKALLDAGAVVRKPLFHLQIDST